LRKHNEIETIVISKFIFIASPRKSLTFSCFFSNLSRAIANIYEDKVISTMRKIIAAILLFTVLLFAFSCAARYYLDAPVSDRIMFADDNQNSDLCRVEDGGLAGAAGECPT